MWGSGLNSIMLALRGGVGYLCKQNKMNFILPKGVSYVLKPSWCKYKMLQDGGAILTPAPHLQVTNL